MSKRTNSSSGTAPRTAKRTRFQDDGSSAAVADAVNAADQQAFEAQIEDNLEGPSRRGAIKNEGYDTDSSDDGEGVVRSRHAGANEVADDDDDMFAPSGAASGSNAAGASAAMKNEPKFVALGDIEGQEFNSRGAGDGDDDELSDEAFVDEDARERKRKEGMGFELTSFNMKAEMEEGRIDEDGTFHRTFDAHERHDKWMEGLDDREIRKARRTKKKMEERERAARVREEEEAAKGKDELAKELVCFLQKGETVLEALQRLGHQSSSGAASSTSAPKRKATRKVQGAAANALPSVSASMDVDDAALNPIPAPSKPVEQSPIERVTALSSTLMSLGNLDVYSETYESLLRSIRRSGIVPPDWVPPIPKYEYRWAPSYLATMQSGGMTSEKDVFGPFGKDELVAWKDASYFGENGERIELRRVGAGDGEWGSWDTVV